MAMELSSQRRTYDSYQYHRYIKHIEYLNIADPDQPVDDSRRSMGGMLGEQATNGLDCLRYLRDLQQFQLAKVPFENLSLHYSSHKTIDLEPDALFEKIVGRGRGGYCMENNCFFGTMLKYVNFDVCSVGARVHEGYGVYTAWSHMVNIVKLGDGKRYLVDVGFGNNGPTQPLLLLDGYEEQSIPPASIRLVRIKIPATTNSKDRLWVYEHRIDPTSDWQPMYCFTETEFLPRDYEMMNFWTSQSRKSFFTHRIMCVKSIMDKKTFKLIGTLILIGAKVKQTIGGKTEQVRICRTEDERVQALDDYFGIKLAEGDKRAIKGMVTALPERDAE